MLRNNFLGALQQLTVAMEPKSGFSPASALRWFFFSSRRRHTRSLCDWSSDVCSSDLACTILQANINSTTTIINSNAIIVDHLLKNYTVDFANSLITIPESQG